MQPNNLGQFLRRSVGTRLQSNFVRDRQRPRGISEGLRLMQRRQAAVPSLNRAVPKAWQAWPQAARAAHQLVLPKNLLHRAVALQDCRTVKNERMNESRNKNYIVRRRETLLRPVTPYLGRQWLKSPFLRARWALVYFRENIGASQ
jgi:hypothetical protein